MSVVELVLALSAVAIFVGAVVFIGAYVYLTEWSRTPLGRHMLWFMLVVAGLSGLAIMRYLDWDNFAGVELLRAFVFVSGAFVVWQRVWLLWRYQAPRRDARLRDHHHSEEN